MISEIVGLILGAFAWVVKNIIWIVKQVLDIVMVLPKEWLAAMVLFLAVTFAGFAIYQSGEHGMTTRMTAWLIMLIALGIIVIVLAGLAGMDLPALLGV